MNALRIRSLVSGASLAIAAALPVTALASGGKDLIALPSLAPLVDSVKAAVVNVEVVSRGASSEEGEGGGPQGFPGFPFNQPMPSPHERARQGMGSGFVIDPKGYILTNNHVVEGATFIRIRFNDGRSFDGEVMGRDPLSDVALVKVRGGVKDLPFLKLGDSDAMHVGDWVVAIGNPFGLASSVSLGIISARARDINATAYDDFLQTDAAINPGNSGGPLFNLKGEVIGMNTAIVSGGTGIGFAVPSNLAKALVPQLERSGSVTRGYMGVATQKLTPEIARALGEKLADGALVYSVEKDSPARKAGLEPDDVIVAVDGQKVDSDGSLRRLVALKSPGNVTNVAIFRKGQPQQLKVTLAPRPETEASVQRRSQKEVNPDEEVSHQGIGLRLRDMDPRLAQSAGLPAEGAVITDLVPGSPAETAELSPGMVVVEANHKAIHSAVELKRAIQIAKPGSSILLRVQFRNSMGAQLRVLRKPN